MILRLVGHLVDEHTDGEIDKDGALTGIDASLHYPHRSQRLNMNTFLFGKIIPEQSLISSYLRRNAQRIF